MDNLVVVNSNDKVLGFKSKAKCHEKDGILHRAFSCYIFNSKGKLLIQKRSNEKPLWHGFWANSCCSHPHKDEPYEKAGERRLPNELGFSCKLTMVGKFEYHAAFEDVGSEWEMCAVLRGEYDGKVKDNPDEVAEWKWIDPKELDKDIQLNPDKYAPWLAPGLAKINGSKFASNQNS